MSRTDLALYVTPAPDPVSPWDRWVPDVLIEVVSPGSEKRDYEEKRREYLAAGVREYWIADPVKKAVLVLERTGDVFREHLARETWASPILSGFVLDVRRIFGEAGPA